MPTQIQNAAPNLAIGDRNSIKRNTSTSGETMRKRTSRTARGVENVQLNIMTDPRVWRGPTHNIYQKQNQNGHDEFHKDMVTGMRVSNPDKSGVRTSSSNVKLINSKDHLEGRGDYECTTRILNIVLEQITDRPIQTSKDVQEEHSHDQYHPPLFVSATTLTDNSTVINHNDLLDFDREVKPLLEVLIGQSLEQALLEVSQEEDDLQRKDEIRMYQEYRNAQVTEVQRLDARQSRYRLEKERRIQEKKLASLRAVKDQEGQEMALYAKQYIASLLPQVHNRMKREGYFDNQLRQELSHHFIPWICESVGKALDDYLAMDLVVQIMTRKIIHENQKTLENNWHDFLEPPLPPTTPIKLRPSQYHIKVIPRIVVLPPSEQTPENHMDAPSVEQSAAQESEIPNSSALRGSIPTSSPVDTSENMENNEPPSSASRADTAGEPEDVQEARPLADLTR